jgi:DNA-binding CsgD family transcriptional regulator/sugar-specific transcriptional regulator TrmB
LLEDLGLDPEAEAVYRFMLTHRDWGVKEIAKSLHCSEPQLGEALNRLADLMLLRRSRDAPSELAPVHPELALQALLQRQQAKLLERQQRLAESQAATAQLIAEYTEARGGISSRAEWLEGLDSVQSRLEELALRAESVCMSFMPGGGQSAESLAASKPLDELMLRRGVGVLTMYVDSVRNDTATLNYARWLTELGGEVRTTPTLPLRMVLFDRKVALVPADLENTRNGALQISFPAVILALAVLFEQFWESGVALGDESHHSDEELTGQERELLRMLARGLTDEAAARDLGVSLRTERRMIANMMRRLGARSRFQAAVKAIQRRWLAH